jgi:hypothetical protein
MLSRDYKCIFVHIPKVAGQSIERVFLGLHGLSWDNRAALLLRPNDEPALGPPRLAHLKASEYVTCGHVTQQDFDSYFKFSFVRNPWSRLVSVYRYLGFVEDMPFKQFLVEKFAGEEDWEPRLFRLPQYDFLFNGSNRQLVDFIGRFENLQAGFDQVCMSIGLSPITLPHVNETGKDRRAMDLMKQMVKRASPFHRRYEEHDHYTKYYDNESIELVARLHAKDLEEFGYSFGE